MIFLKDRLREDKVSDHTFETPVPELRSTDPPSDCDQAPGPGKEDKGDREVSSEQPLLLPGADQTGGGTHRSGLSNSIFIFCFIFFVKKIIDLPGGLINGLSSGNTFLFRSSQKLPRLLLGPLKGFLS